MARAILILALLVATAAAARERHRTLFATQNVTATAPSLNVTWGTPADVKSSWMLHNLYRDGMLPCGADGNDWCWHFGATGHTLIMACGVVPSIVIAVIISLLACISLRRQQHLTDYPEWPLYVAQQYYAWAHKQWFNSLFLLCDGQNRDEHHQAESYLSKLEDKGVTVPVTPNQAPSLPELPSFYCVREAVPIKPDDTLPGSAKVRVAMCDVHCTMRPMAGVVTLNITWAVANLAVAALILVGDVNAGTYWWASGLATCGLILLHICAVLYLANYTVPKTLDSSIKRMSVCNLSDWGHVIMCCVVDNRITRHSFQGLVAPGEAEAGLDDAVRDQNDRALYTWCLQPICTLKYMINHGKTPAGYTDAKQGYIRQCFQQVESACNRMCIAREALMASMGMSVLAILLLAIGNIDKLDQHGIVSSLNALSITFTLAALTRLIDAVYRAELACLSNGLAATSMAKANFPWATKFDAWLEPTWQGRWRLAKTFLWGLKEDNETKPPSTLYEHNTRKEVYDVGMRVMRPEGSQPSAIMKHNVEKILIGGMQVHRQPQFSLHQQPAE